MFIIIQKNILWNLFLANYFFQMLAAATSQMVHPLSPVVFTYPHRKNTNGVISHGGQSPDFKGEIICSPKCSLNKSID